MSDNFGRIYFCVAGSSQLPANGGKKQEPFAGTRQGFRGMAKAYSLVAPEVLLLPATPSSRKCGDSWTA